MREIEREEFEALATGARVIVALGYDFDCKASVTPSKARGP
jgi:hypothetical protein